MRAGQGLQALVGFAVAANGQPMHAIPELAAGIGNVKIPGRGHGHAAQHRPVPAHALLFRQQAAAGRGGNAGDAELPGQGQLPAAAAAPEVPELAAVQDAGLLHRRGGELFGAQGPHQQVAHVGLAGDDVQGVAPLAHGALAQHLAGNDALGAVFLQQASGRGEHENLAVHAGVKVLAKAVGWPLQEQAHIGLAHVHGHEIQAIGVLPLGQELGFAKKGTDKMQPGDAPALGQHQPGGKDRVQPSGKERQGMVCG